MRRKAAGIAASCLFSFALPKWSGRVLLRSCGLSRRLGICVMRRQIDAAPHRFLDSGAAIESVCDELTFRITEIRNRLRDAKYVAINPEMNRRLVVRRRNENAAA